LIPIQAMIGIPTPVSGPAGPFEADWTPMLFVPIPFVVTLLLVILLVRLIMRNDERSANRLFLALIGVYAVLSILIGLRWGYGLRAVLPWQSILAALGPPLAWLSFSSLTEGGGSRFSFRSAWHLLPAGIVALLIALWPEPIDVAIIATYLIYGIMLARLAWAGPDVLRLARLDEAPLVHRALQATAAALILSATLDAMISIDVRWWNETYAPLAVGLANLLMLLLLGFAAAVAGHRPAPGQEGEAQPLVQPADEEDVGVVRRIDDLMRARGLFRDCDLNLDRLARIVGIPARHISTAINRVEGKNVSQYVNDHRIAEACRLLDSTDQPVTAVMFEAGFQTKSNFNREFRRVTGMSPSDWKAKNAAAPKTALPASQRRVIVR